MSAEDRGQMRCVVLGKACQVVDLSYPLNGSTIFWPGGEGFKLCMNTCRNEEHGYDYAAGVFTCSEHGGTHVDAPYHFKLDGKTVDQIPLTDLMGSCKVLEVTKQCNIDANYTLQPEDILAFEQQYGALGLGDIVLVRTGWHRKYSQGAAEYLGYDEKTQGPYTDSVVLRFPSIGKEAAEMLVARNVTAVGLDTASIDPGYSKDFIVHQVLLGAGIYGVENINGNIDLLPPCGSTLMIMPMKITGGSGAPARVVAFLDT